MGFGTSSTVFFPAAATPYVVVLLGVGSYTGMWLSWKAAREGRLNKLLERSMSWPEIPGVVLGSKVRWAHVETNYEYIAGGQRYTGLHETSLGLPYPTPSLVGARRFQRESGQIMAEFSPGTKLIIRFNPFNPSESVLFCRAEPLSTSRNKDN
jgi:Protein of unknown function (DUF3592)